MNQNDISKESKLKHHTERSSILAGRAIILMPKIIKKIHEDNKLTDRKEVVKDSRSVIKNTKKSIFNQDFIPLNTKKDIPFSLLSNDKNIKLLSLRTKKNDLSVSLNMNKKHMMDSSLTNNCSEIKMKAELSLKHNKDLAKYLAPMRKQPLRKSSGERIPVQENFRTLMMLEKSKIIHRKYLCNFIYQQNKEWQDYSLNEKVSDSLEVNTESFMPQIPALKGSCSINRKAKYISTNPRINRCQPIKVKREDMRMSEEYDEFEELREMERRKEIVNAKLNKLNSFMGNSKQRIRIQNMNLVNNKYCKLPKGTRLYGTGNTFNIKRTLKCLYNS